MRNRAGVRRLAGLGGATAAVGLGVMLACGGLGITAAAADDSQQGGGGGIGISVQIPTPTPTPTAAAPTPAQDAATGFGDSSTGGVGSLGGGSGTVPGLPSGVATPGSTPAAIDPAMANGLLNVGGLDARFVPSLNPGAGTVTVSLTVHNGSTQTIASRLEVWLTGPVGNRLASSGTIALKPLKAGATTQVQADVDGVGQWTVVTAHARYTPPATIDGQPVKAVDRDATIFAFPWANAVVAMLAATGAGIVVVVRLPAAAALAVAA